MTLFPGIVFTAVIPELILLGTAVAGLIWGMVLPRKRQWRVAALAAVGTAAALLASAAHLLAPRGIVFEGVFADDLTMGVARVVILAGTLLVVAMSLEHTRDHPRETEYYVLVVLSTLGAILLAGAMDLMLIVAAYLLSSIPLYPLTAFRKDTPGTEAALKVYLMAAMFNVLLLFGLVWLYGVSGTTLLVQVAARLSPEVAPLLTVALIGGFGGLLFKLGAVPGHYWVPDAAEGAPAPVAGFLTTIPKIGGLVAVARLLAVAFPPELVDWPLLVGVVAAITMTLGNLAAFWQTSPRRLLGYSTISQAGYLLIGIAALTGSDLALPGLLYYLGAYTVMNLGAWAIIAELPDAETLLDYRGLSRSQPALALSLLVMLLSLAGIPPLGGFFAKLLVFSAAWGAGLKWLVVVAAINVVASLFYYLRWIAPVYLGTPATAGQPMLSGWWAKLAAFAAAIATIGIGIGARALLDVAAGATLGG